MNENKHLYVVDQLRGAAILMVIIHHAYGYSKSIHTFPPVTSELLHIPNLLDFVFHCTIANGFLGVMIFFVLSGFCIRWSHLQTSSFNWGNFYQRRFFRIVPAYWFWLVVGSLIVAAKPWDFVLHALLLHNLRADSYHSIIAPLWSIAIEWQIYILYPLILFFVARLKKTWVLMFFAFANLGSSLLSSDPVAEILGSDILRIIGRLPTALMFSWMLGFYLANTLHEGGRVNLSIFPLVLSILMGIATYMHPNTIFLSSVPWSFAAYYLVAQFVLRKTESNFFKIKGLAFIGIISYSTYLCHDLFGQIYPFIERKFVIGKGSFYDGLYVLCILISPIIIIGFLSYKYIELNGIQIGKILNQGFGKSINK